jgi:hypothetical protein
VKRLGLGIVLLVIVASLVFLARGGGRRPSASPPPGGAAAGSHQGEPTLLEVEGSDEGETQRTRVTAEMSPSSPPASEAAAPETGAVALTIRARLVDERGAPLAGGRLGALLEGEEFFAESTPDGEVALALRYGRSPAGSRWSFEATAPGRIRRSIEVERALIAQNTSYFLGEIVLHPGGSLAGRVLDERGSLVPHARVIARPPATEANPAERVFLPWGYFGDGISVSGSCDADGSYRLNGVPCGPVEVLASEPTLLVARSGVLEVRAGLETRVPDLVLGTPQDADRIAGRVTHPDGRPFPGLDIGLASARDDGGHWPGTKSDADGRFALLAARDVVYTVLARDASTRRMSKSPDVRAGDLGVEIVFGAAPMIELAVRDERGPVAGFRVVIENDAHRGVGGARSTEPGLLRLELPAAVFHLQVISPYHLTQRLGPFDPSRTPERLEVVLVRAGGVSGTVLAAGDGAPAAGAEVHAHPAIPEASFGFLPEDFVTFLDPRISSEATTDGNGRFFLPLQASNRYRLHASTSGGAWGVSAWVDHAGAVADGFDILLPVSGAIEGHLLVASGVDARGTWIGASDGEGHVELAQTGENGAFRFAELAPGRWQVHRIQGAEAEYLVRNRNYWPAEDETEPPAWDVVVPEGKTVTFDIDARDEVPCSLEGRLAFDGEGAQGFSAFLDVAAKSTLLDADGRFTLRALKAGRYPLYLSGGEAQLQVWLELAAGPNAWELDLPTGTVQLDNLPPVPLDPRMGRQENWPEYALSWTRGELRWTALLQEGPASSAKLEHVPAGALVLRWRSGGAHPNDEQNWPVLAEIELASGELAAVRIP